MSVDAKQRADNLVFRTRIGTTMSFPDWRFFPELDEEETRRQIQEAIEEAEQERYREIAADLKDEMNEHGLPRTLFGIRRLHQKYAFLGKAPQSERDQKREMELALFIHKLSGNYDQQLAKAALALENGHDVRLVGSPSQIESNFWDKENLVDAASPNG